MPHDLEQLRRTTPDLAHLDPLSTEVRRWLDQAYETLNRADHVEATILRLHERSLLDPPRKTVASEEIVKTIDRAKATREIMSRMGLKRRAS